MKSIPDEIILHISDYLNYYDFKKLQQSNSHLEILLKNKFTLKAPNIIHSFMLKTRDIKNVLEQKINSKNSNMNSYELALYYFFFYENQYIDSWLKGVHCEWKHNIIQSYNIYVPEKVNKYDLFHVQKKMTPHEIVSIGW